MKVNNNFPNVDKVLKKLKEFTNFFREKRNNANELELEDCEFAEDFVEKFVSSIEKYLDSVCNADIRIRKIKESTSDIKEVQYAVQREDQMRTGHHSNIISSMIMIDRMADIYKLPRVFDYAEEFDKDFSRLTPSSIEEKREMTERERIKRREMGNFGLYIAAAVTAGVSREAQNITDDDLREFANCEGDTVNANSDVFYKIKSNSQGVKRNINYIIHDDKDDR